ncbi:MAG: hybrid sensor histidine kinase/response regulator [Prochlorotrichaceae cyanobacterium]|jgi:signal transduction histidine kinase
MKDISILIIDDEPDNFDVIEAFLNKPNYQLFYAANGESGLSALENLTPDLILLDVMMPGIDGIEVCRRIRERSQWQSIPIIMVTALTAKEDLARCLASGADDFISKPLNSYELRARVQSMLRIKAQYDQLETFSKFQRNTINLLGRNLQELTGNLSHSFPHELNTPLNGIIGVIQLLKADFESLDREEIQELLHMAEHSAERLEKLTKRFMLYLELETYQGRSPSVTPVTTLSVSHDIHTEIQQKMMAAKREEDIQLELGVHTLPLSDRYWRSILFELLDNAIKFSSPKTPIHIRSYIKEGNFYLEVQDQGVGMSPEQIARIDAFTKFHPQNYTHEGLGLGLKTVQKMLELLGGKLKISSQEEKGTQVCVSLPLD